MTIRRQKGCNDKCVLQSEMIQETLQIKKNIDGEYRVRLGASALKAVGDNDETPLMTHKHSLRIKENEQKFIMKCNQIRAFQVNRT